MTNTKVQGDGDYGAARRFQSPDLNSQVSRLVTTRCVRRRCAPVPDMQIADAVLQEERAGTIGQTHPNAISRGFGIQRSLFRVVADHRANCANRQGLGG